MNKQLDGAYLTDFGIDIKRVGNFQTLASAWIAEIMLMVFVTKGTALA